MKQTTTTTAAPPAKSHKQFKTVSWLLSLVLCAVMFSWHRQHTTLRHLTTPPTFVNHDKQENRVALPLSETTISHIPEEEGGKEQHYTNDDIKSIATAATTTGGTTKKTEGTKRKAQPQPTFDFYVGLPKTATTFLQCTLCANTTATQPVLARDNLVYLGTCPYKTCGLEAMPTTDNMLIHRFGAFFTNAQKAQEGMGPQRHLDNTTAKTTTTARDKLSPLLKRALRHAKGKNALLIYEGAHVFPKDFIHLLATTLTHQYHWKVRILVGYRPLYEWLPSKYNSVHKNYVTNVWPGVVKNFTRRHTGQAAQRTGVAVLPFDLHNRGEFSDSLVYDITTRFFQHPAQTVRDNYQRHFEQVEVLPLHEVKSKAASKVDVAKTADPLLEYLFCRVIRNSPRTCQHIQRGGWNKADATTKKMNPSVSLDPDGLAVAAYQAGLLPTAMKRRFVGQEIMQHFEQLKKQQDQDHAEQHQESFWPITCWDEAKMQRLEELSWSLERQLFAYQNDTERRQQHAQGFAAAHAKFCHIDTAAALQHATWRAFFANLTASFVLDSENLSDES